MRFNGILADEMGFGKQSSARTDPLKKTPGARSQASLSSADILAGQLGNQANRFTPQLKTILIRATTGQEFNEMENADPGHHILCFLRRDGFEYEGLEFDHVILDEAQHIKNPKTANAKVTRASGRNIG